MVMLMLTHKEQYNYILDVYHGKSTPNRIYTAIR